MGIDHTKGEYAMVRGKFVVKAIEHTEHSTIIKFRAVYDDGIEENKRFAKATPTGTIEMQVDNPKALNVFDIGDGFYVDFVPVE